MRHYSVEITPVEGTNDWETFAGSLPPTDLPLACGPHEEDFFIATDAMPVTEAFEALRGHMIAKMQAEITHLHELMTSLRSLPCPQFAALDWSEHEAQEAA